MESAIPLSVAVVPSVESIISVSSCLPAIRYFEVKIDIVVANYLYQRSIPRISLDVNRKPLILCKSFEFAESIINGIYPPKVF